MQVAANIFREYDIRGVAGETFSEKAILEYEKWYGPFPGINITLDIAEALGRAYGTIIRRDGGRNVVVGYEVRPFAEELTISFIRGIRRTGCHVTELGVALTPVVYFTTAFSGYDGGVNVTGSHNVYFFNGFKMMRKNVAPIYGEELQQMRQMVLDEAFIEDADEGSEKFNGYEAYRKYFLEHVKLTRKPKIVIDCGNGSSGPFAPELFGALGCDVMGLYIEPDATFPNHVPDPEDPYNMAVLGKKVREVGADFGIGFDADADRVGFVDESGEFVDADLIILLLARDVLTRHFGKKILYDTKCSRLLNNLIPTYNGVPLMHKTGHAPIKATLRSDSDVIFGGEASGHFFFVEDYFKFDDGLMGAGRVLELYCRHNGSFSSLFQGIPKTVRTPELKLPCADELKFNVVKDIRESLEQRYKIITIDGVRIVISPTSWGLVRASNTSPYLTIRAEADTAEEVIATKNIIADELEKFPAVSDRLNRNEVTSHTGKLGWV